MDDRLTAFQKHWDKQWFDFDDTDTTERRKRIAKDAFEAGWNAALTEEVQDKLRATARAEALREAAEEQIAAILERLRVADRLEANADRLAEALAKLADENNLPWTGVVVQEFARAALAAHEDLDGRA